MTSAVIIKKTNQLHRYPNIQSVIQPKITTTDHHHCTTLNNTKLPWSDVKRVVKSQLNSFFIFWSRRMARKLTNEHHVKCRYAEKALVEMVQIDDLNVHVDFLSKMIPCHQHLGALVQCDTMCHPDILSL